MATQETKRYMELQMEELKAANAVDNDTSAPKKKNPYQNEKNAEIARMYEDTAEYEEDLKCFKDELEIVNKNKLENIAEALTKELPDEERNYAQELQIVLQAGWTEFVEVEKTHPKEQLDLIKETDFNDVLQKLNTLYPDYDGNFEAEIRAILVKRWEALIALKQEHIKQEIAEIKTSGLKINYVKRIYEKYHNIS